MINWDKVFKNGLSKIFLKTVFDKFYSILEYFAPNNPKNTNKS